MRVQFFVAATPDDMTAQVNDWLWAWEDRCRVLNTTMGGVGTPQARELSKCWLAIWYQPYTEKDFTGEQ